MKKKKSLVTIGGGMAKAGVGFSPGRDFINIVLLVLCKKFCNFQLNYQKILKICVEPFNIMLLAWVKISEFLEKFRNLMKNHNLTSFTLLDVIFNPTIRSS